MSEYETLPSHRQLGYHLMISLQIKFGQDPDKPSNGFVITPSIFGKLFECIGFGGFREKFLVKDNES
ncbi:MAG: hypothetical protein ACTSPW_13060, partial [Promethearchaeota archaeon]